VRVPGHVIVRFIKRFMKQDLPIKELWFSDPQNPKEKSSFRRKVGELWDLLEPYRLGFGLGVLAVAATVALVLTGQKSEKLNYQTHSIQQVVTVPQEAGVSGSPQMLGASVSAQPSDGSSRLRSNNNNSPSLRGTRPAAISPGKININTGSAIQLDTLPQIGPVTAKAIVDYRTAHGAFKTINELDNVKGIGPKTIEKIRSLVTVE